MRALILVFATLGLTLGVGRMEEPQRLPEYNVSRAPLGSVGLRLTIDLDGKEDAASRIKSIVIAGVVAHSAAEQAGLRARDTIVALDHHAVSAMTLGELKASLNAKNRGDDIVIGYMRPKTKEPREVSLRLQQ